VNGSTSSGQFISDWCRQALQDHWRIQGHTYIHTYIQIYIAPKIVRTNLRRYATVLWAPEEMSFQTALEVRSQMIKKTEFVAASYEARKLNPQDVARRQ